METTETHHGHAHSNTGAYITDHVHYQDVEGVIRSEEDHGHHDSDQIGRAHV